MTNTQDIGNGYGYIYGCKVDGATILYSEANTPDGLRNIKDRAVANAPIVATKSAAGKIIFSSVASAGSITSITVGGIQIIGAPIPCATNDINEYAKLVADAINLHLSIPNWTAQAILGEVNLISPLGNPDTLNDQVVVVVATAPSIVFTTENTSGGIVNDLEYDKLYGARYMLNADYDANYNTNTTPASPTALGNHIEITKYIISRGSNVGANTKRLEVSDNTLVDTDRICDNTNYIIDTEGGAASDYLTTINPEDFIEGDIVYIQGRDTARKTTVVSIPNAAAVSPATQPNIQLAGDVDFITGGPDQGLQLRYVWSEVLQRYIFTEVSRSKALAPLLNAGCAFVPLAPYTRGMNFVDDNGEMRVKYYCPEGGANYVDSIHGNDTTAKTGDRECCFKTIEAAYNNAIANSVTRIYISSGNYTETGACLYGGITYICAPDVTITGDVLWVSFGANPVNILGFPNIIDNTVNYVSIVGGVLEIGRLVRNGGTVINFLFGAYRGHCNIDRADITFGGIDMGMVSGRNTIGELRIDATGAPAGAPNTIPNADVGIAIVSNYTLAGLTDRYALWIPISNIKYLAINGGDGGVRADEANIGIYQYNNCVNPIWLANNKLTIGAMIDNAAEAAGATTYDLITLAASGPQIVSLEIGSLQTTNTVRFLKQVEDISASLSSLSNYYIDIKKWEYKGNTNTDRPLSDIKFADGGTGRQGRIYIKAVIDCFQGGMQFSFGSYNGTYGNPDTGIINELAELIWEVEYREHTNSGQPTDIIMTLKNIENTELRGGKIIAGDDLGRALITDNNTYATPNTKVLYLNGTLIKTITCANDMIKFDGAAVSMYYLRSCIVLDENGAASFDGSGSAGIYVLDNNCIVKVAANNWANVCSPDTDLILNPNIDVY